MDKWTTIDNIFGFERAFYITTKIKRLFFFVKLMEPAAILFI